MKPHMFAVESECGLVKASSVLLRLLGMSPQVAPAKAGRP